MFLRTTLKAKLTTQDCPEYILEISEDQLTILYQSLQKNPKLKSDQKIAQLLAQLDEITKTKPKTI